MESRPPFFCYKFLPISLINNLYMELLLILLDTYSVSTKGPIVSSQFMYSVNNQSYTSIWTFSGVLIG